MKSIQTFLEEFHCIPFEEKATILLQAWFKFFAIKHDQPEDSNELFQKLIEDLKELAEYKESLENSSKEIAASNSNPKKEGPQQDSDIHTSQISPIHVVTPILSTKEPEYSPSMGYENSNTTSKTESDEIIKSGVEELVPILSKNEVTLEDKRECDLLDFENSPVCDKHSEILSDSKNDDDISSDDDDFEDVEYVDASLSDPEIVSVEENDVYQEEEEVDLEDVFQIQDIVLREKLLSINRLIANIKSLNDNPTPDCVLNFFVSIPIFEESDNYLLYNFLPEFETFCDHTKSGNTTTHANDSLPEYDLFCFEIEPDQERLINVGTSVFWKNHSSMIPFSHESSDSNFEDNPSVPLPPPEPPDAETDAGEEILVVMNDEFDDENYFSFMFVKVCSLISLLEILNCEEQEMIE
nr:hypothetical protein [Tanacetum cinerariifolium]